VIGRSIVALAAFLIAATVPAQPAALVPAGTLFSRPSLSATGWRLPRLRSPRHSPLRTSGAAGTYGMHGSGPALAALDAVPAGVTAPGSLDSFSLTAHGGPIQPSTTTYAIYWDPPGATLDSGYRPLIDRYLTDSGASAVYATLTQYAGSNGSVGAVSTFGGSLVDQDRIPNPLTRAGILNEVESVLAQFDFTPGIGDEVFLLLPHGALPNNGYCAYHGGAAYRSGQFALALIPYPDVAGCGEEYDFLTPNDDLIADGGVAEVSVAQAGMITDPLLDGWYDDKHGEVGDLCFEDFGVGINNRGADLIVSAHGKVDSYAVPKVYSSAAQGCAPAL
jgi:hypothetical protein